MDEVRTVVLLELAAYIGLPIVLLLLQWRISRAIEGRHLRSLDERERMAEGFVVTTLKTACAGDADPNRKPCLVTGEAVISSDCFKNWLFGFVSFFGGESRSFTRLFERARREALLRMVDQARAAGYNAICNVRFGTADIAGTAATNGRKNTMKMAACSVFGTAYVRI